GYTELPADFFDHPVPPWLMSLVLRGRLIDSGYGTMEEGEAIVVDRLKADDPAAWMALAAFADHPPETNVKSHFDRLYAIITKAGLAQDAAEVRMATVLPVLRAISRREPILPAATAEAAATLFRSEPEFQPLLTLCAAACPQTKDQCTTAFVAAFGHPYGRVTTSQPLTSLVATEDFFATPRGRLILLRSTQGAVGDDPATSPALAAARQIDACLADAILAALR
ncbi:MAG TPA: hypothetical protein VK146_14665, partial [Tabrizicola sp.]|nr:hypothetical protein [Tabrizicola sp.]